ncbi:MAG: glycosyltransferase family 39 protein [Candidatus Pacebacteria bacterium]|nr:glycosyltransferase family 39 protein [Candidatus Paceibacterota bacterium]
MAKINKTFLFLLIILVIASFFRLWQLDSIPPGLYPDVAINGNDAIDSLRTYNFKVFYPENNGREGLFIWLIALSFSIFGVSIWSIKIVAAIIGILTVLGLYLLTKELFSQYYENDSRSIALLASFFLATSFWHTNFSRLGFRAILMPFILIFAFYFLFRGFRRKRILDFIISGVFFGFGFYTYISYRFIVLLLPLILICWWLIYHKKKRNKEFLLFTVYCLLFAVIVALPIGFYFIKNPQDFVGRAAPISIFAAENPLKELGKSLVAHLGMFNFRGDSNWRHNFSGKPELFWPAGILFLIGIALSIKKLIISLKNKNCSLFAIHCLLLISWFFIMLLPGILTYEGIPHALRTIGVIPVVYIFAGFGFWKIYQWFDKNTRRKRLLLSATFLFLLMTGIVEFDKYFNKWGGHPEVKNAFSADYVEIGNFLNSLPAETQKYVIVNQPGVPVPWPDGIPVPAQTIMFIENAKFGSPQSTYLLPEDLNQIKINSRKAVIIAMRREYDESLFAKIQQKFPEGEIQEKDGTWIYRVNF